MSMSQLNELIMARESFRAFFADSKEGGFIVLDNGDIALAPIEWGNTAGGDSVEEVTAYFNKVMGIIDGFLSETIGSSPVFEVAAVRKLLVEA